MKIDLPKKVQRTYKYVTVCFSIWKSRIWRQNWPDVRIGWLIGESKRAWEGTWEPCFDKGIEEPFKHLIVRQNEELPIIQLVIFSYFLNLNSKVSSLLTIGGFIFPLSWPVLQVINKPFMIQYAQTKHLTTCIYKQIKFIHWIWWSSPC